jgi:hypothetical protein
VSFTNLSDDLQELGLAKTSACNNGFSGSCASLARVGRCNENTVCQPRAFVILPDARQGSNLQVPSHNSLLFPKAFAKLSLAAVEDYSSRSTSARKSTNNGNSLRVSSNKVMEVSLRSSQTC